MNAWQLWGTRSAQFAIQVTTHILNPRLRGRPKRHSAPAGQSSASPKSAARARLPQCIDSATSAAENRRLDSPLHRQCTASFDQAPAHMPDARRPQARVLALLPEHHCCHRLAQPCWRDARCQLTSGAFDCLSRVLAYGVTAAEDAAKATFCASNKASMSSISVQSCCSRPTSACASCSLPISSS